MLVPENKRENGIIRLLESMLVIIIIDSDFRRTNKYWYFKTKQDKSWQVTQVVYRLM